YLPLPTVKWHHAAFSLDVDATADGSREAPQLLARYTLRNLTDHELSLTLALAVRPWQVNPPQQFLSTQGGASPIHRVGWDAGVLRIDDRALRPTQQPEWIGATGFDAGMALDTVERTTLRSEIVDPQNMASAALTFRVALPPRSVQTIGWVSPLDAPAIPARISQA